MQFRAVKGMNDILPGEVERWQRLESAFISAARNYGYSEARPPLVEPTGLFVRSIGEVTDVVQKEMYTFERGKESLTLRPEGTASCVRAYVEHSVHAREPVSRWYYLGPMFRAERPQKGRYRQFYQAGCEVYGDLGPAVDAELVSMLVELFTSLGITPLRVLVNSVGGKESRARYRQLLLDFLRPKASQLSELSQQRLEKNPLRVLDSKHPGDQELVRGAPSTVDALEPEDREHWQELIQQLTALEVPFEVSPSLVRGLDYYSRTLFEIQSTAGDLGAQNTLAGGGRYDGLVKSLGGPEVPGIGFAMGLERILLAMKDVKPQPPPGLALVPLGTEPTRAALALARELRAAGLRVTLDGRCNSLKSKLRRVNASGETLCVVLGDSELERDVLQVKNLAAHNSEDVPRDQAVTVLKELVKKTFEGADV